ncbi:hypothetical protein SLITO_v1c08530 [Spiroplasma litorale]|uniref:MFS transporter n=2 Tax=Spiroplasma litorale TaxID=216942 RepID=A0A0K1W2R7_9MOLU|nr:hypothetical protein SLITO_v1c08530 [Spiroplasma litorale]
MNNWDLLIMLPILFAMCFFTLLFIVFKEKVKKNQIIFLVNTALLWVILGYLSNQNSNNIPSTLLIDKAEYFSIVILGTSLFLVFLKPLATFITGIIRNRFIWIKITYVLVFILLVIDFFTKNYINSYLFVFTTLLLSICLASSTIFFLYCNEQYYYRIYVLPVVWIIFSFIGFGTAFGTYLNELKVLFTNYYYQNTIIVLCIILIIYLFSYSFFIQENKNLAGVFDKEIIDSIPKKNNFNFFLIYLIVFLVSITSSLNNSLIVKMFIGLNLRDYGIDYNNVISLLRTFNFLYTIPSILISYFIYKFALKYFGQKYLIFACLFLIFGAYTILAFTTNPFIYISVNVFTGILFNQIVFSLFSLCIMWNYRSPKNPVTGFFGSAMFGAKFIVSSIEKIIANLKKGVFHNVGLLSDLENIKNVNSDSLKEFDIATTLMMSFSCMIILICILVFYFKNNSFFADYINYNNATRNIKNLLKKRIMEKAKTKIDFSGKEKEVKSSENIEK